MLNINFQCCGMTLICLVAIFYFSLPKIEFRTNKIFGRLLAVSALCAASDIASVAAIFYSDKFPDFWVKASCKIYLLFLMMMFFSGFVYICADIFKLKKSFHKLMVTSGICFTAVVTSMMFLPIYYVCEDGGNTIYSYGPLAAAVYIFFSFLSVLMIVLVFIGRKNIHPRRMLAIKAWMAVWITSAVIQFIFSDLLIITFAGCLEMLIIFIMIENPELSLDKESGFFRTSILPQFLSEILADKKFFLINTHFRNEQTEFYENIKNCTIFVGGGEIFLVFEEKSDFDSALTVISEEFRKQHIYICEDDSIAETPDELLNIIKEAQQFIKKERPKNICHVDAEAKQWLEERRNTELLINEALEEGRVEVFFQPIYSIQNGTFCSAEALARIREKNGDIVPPWKFIPVAEENGSIINLGKIIFEKVCVFLKENSEQELGLKYIEVNLSVIQGEDKGLSADITSIMNRHSISSDKINLEITESVSVNGRNQLLENMTTLIKEGIEFSLDDFGTGQSNLDYISAMPVQLVKFDYSMTQSYFKSEKTRCVMTAAVKMIHEMGMKIVIEGIETEEQLEGMKKLGADYIQGFYFSKPLPEAEFIEFLKKNTT